MDGNSLALKPRCVDVVFCADVLEHFPDLQRPLRAIKRVLRWGGRILVNSPLETPFFKLSRLVIGFDKPRDHYASAYKIHKTIEKFFKIDEVYRFPSPRFLSILEIVRGVKE
jgi:ubiquinone/menaquinone biosynthesis C-methylase UbiE